MTRRTGPLAVSIMLAAAACVVRTGHPASEDARVVSAQGIIGTLSLSSGGTATGELLSVDEAAFVILADTRVLVVPFSAISSGTFSRPGAQHNTRIPIRGSPTAERQRELRDHSRYPYGIPAPAMAALLNRAGQSKPDIAPHSPP